MKFITIDVETVHEREGFALMPYVPGIQISTVYAETHTGKPLLKKVFPEHGALVPFFEKIVAQGYKVAGWNIMYDIAVFHACGVPWDLLHQIDWLDGRTLWMRWEMARKAFARQEKNSKAKNLRYSLDQAITDLLDQDTHKEGVEYNVEPHETDKIAALMKYNILDVERTTALVRKFLKEIPAEERPGILTDAAIPSLCAEAWMNGIKMDEHKLRTIQSRNEMEMVKLAQGLGLTLKVLGSPTQLGDLLFNQWGLKPIKTSEKTGKPSTDAYTLIMLGTKNKNVQEIHKVRKLKGQVSKFVKTPLESLELLGSDTTHPQPRQCGTYTRRMTYSSKTYSFVDGKSKELKTGVAIHQWERDKQLRELVQAPDGHLIVELDAAAQEMRLAADWSGDENMLKIFNEGLDAHSWFAAKLYDYEYRVFMRDLSLPGMKLKRHTGKFGNLSMLYRVGARKMIEQAVKQYDLWLTSNEIDKLRRTWKEAFRGYIKWQQDAIWEAKRKGYAETRDGSKVELKGWNGRDDWALESTAINTPIQGTGAVMKNAALKVARPIVSKAGGSFMLDMHDGLFFTLPEAVAMDVGLELQEKFNNLNYGVFGWEPKLELPWDLSIGPDWGNIKEIK